MHFILLFLDRIDAKFLLRFVFVFQQGQDYQKMIDNFTKNFGSKEITFFIHFLIDKVKSVLDNFVSLPV